MNDRLDIADGVFTKGHGLHVAGEHNRVSVASSAKLTMSIRIIGSHNAVTIGPSCVLRGAIVIMASSARLRIGAGTTSMGLRILMHEPESITIGDDCMFSAGILMNCSDMHSVVEVASGRQINPPGRS